MDSDKKTTFDDLETLETLDPKKFLQGLVEKKANGIPPKRREVDFQELPALQKGLQEKLEALTPENFQAMLPVIRELLTFTYYNSKSEVNIAIEEMAQQTVLDNLERFEPFISSKNLETSAEIFLIFSNLKRVKSPEKVAKILDVLSQHTDVITSILIDSALSFEIFPLIELIIHHQKQPGAIKILELYKHILLSRTDENTRIITLIDLIESKNQKNIDFARNILIQQLSEGFEVDGALFLDVWDSCVGESGNRSVNYMRNFETMQLLEKSEKGIVSTLYREFGIINFGRYPIEILLTQYKERDVLDKPYGVVIFPYDDWNGSFFSNDSLLDFFNQLQGEFGLKISEGGGKFRITKTLLGILQKYGKCSFGIIGGHGSSDSIYFGKKVRGNLLSKDYLFSPSDLFEFVPEQGFSDTPRPAAQKLMQYFTEDVQFILKSCSTGKGEDPIAKQISRLGARVTSPDATTTIDNYLAVIKDGKLHLSATYRPLTQDGVRTRTFEDGVEVSSE